jgi:hypothetical protein
MDFILLDNNEELSLICAEKLGDQVSGKVYKVFLAEP